MLGVWEGAVIFKKNYLEVLLLVSEGLPSGEIAERLGLSKMTVQSYCQQLREEIGAVTLAHAVGIGYREGWLKP